jgi:hypothetical protein
MRKQKKRTWKSIPNKSNVKEWDWKKIEKNLKGPKQCI